MAWGSVVPGFETAVPRASVCFSNTPRLSGCARSCECGTYAPKRRPAQRSKVNARENMMGKKMCRHAYGMAIRTMSRRLVNRCRIRANPRSACESMRIANPHHRKEAPRCHGSLHRHNRPTCCSMDTALSTLRSAMSVPYGQPACTPTT